MMRATGPSPLASLKSTSPNTSPKFGTLTDNQKQQLAWAKLDEDAFLAKFPKNKTELQAMAEDERKTATNQLLERLSTTENLPFVKAVAQIFSEFDSGIADNLFDALRLAYIRISGMAQF